MDETLKRRKDSICRYRIQRIKSNKKAWILWGASFVLSVICITFNTYSPKCDSQLIKVLFALFEAFSIGYFSGFIVYIFVTFLPTTKKDVDTKDKIYFQLYQISKGLEDIYNSIAPKGSKGDFRICETLFYNYLVKNVKIIDLYNEESKSDNLIIDKDNLNNLFNKLSFLNEDIERTLYSYGNVLKSDDVEILYKLSKTKSELEDSINEEDNTYNKNLFELFIMDYVSLAYIQFNHIFNYYSLYKYWEPKKDE